MPIILGNPYDLSGIRNRFRPRIGQDVEVEYQGEELRLLDLQTQFAVQGLEASMERQGPVSVLRVQQPSEQPTLEIRMQVNRIQKDILSPQPGFSLLDDETLRVIREATRNPKAGTPPSGLTGAAATLYSLVMAGVKYRIVYQPVLFIVRTAGPSWVWDSSHLNGVGLIHSDAQMLADQGLASLINFPSPSAAFSGAPAGFVYGWLKHCPWYDTSVGNRTTENVEFEFGLWSLFLYGVV